jgi:ABC-type bacteriocin/lantibiotic exporter with double-glycine peptidase domain
MSTATTETAAMVPGLSAMASITGYEQLLDTAASGHHPGDTPAMAAFRAVADHLGCVTPAIPMSQAGEPLAEELGRLAAANNLILREISTETGWDEAGQGPLIALRRVATGQTRPVALIRVGSRWRIVDGGAGGRSEPLTDAIERDLLPRAHLVCRALPARAMSFRDLALFGIGDVKRELAGFALMSLLTGLAATALPIATGMITSTVLPGREYTLLVEVLVMIVMMLLANVATQQAAALTQLRIDGRLGAMLRTAAIDRLVRSTAPALRSMPPTNQAMVLRMVESWQRMLRHVVLSLASALIIALPSLVLMATIAPMVALVVFVVILVAAVAAAALAGHQAEATVQGEMGPLGWVSTSYEALSQLDTVRSSHAEAHVFARWSDGFLLSQRRGLRSGRIGAYSQALQHAFQGIVLMAAIATLAMAKFTADASVSVTFVMATMTVAGSAAALLGSFSTFGSMAIQARMIAPLLQSVPPARATAPALKLKGAIRASGLSVRRSADGPLVLSGVNFEINPGEHVGIVGPSGSGKSTLLGALIGLVPVVAGQITFDGIDLRKLDAAAIRRQIGLVGQGAKLFAGSVRDNIKAGLDLSDDDIWKALEIAAVDRDVASLGLGLSTPISDADPTLSGGQVQRILLARAVAGNPKIVILDEGTSAIDPPTRAKVTRNLAGLGVGIISIAHRLDTLVGADRIHVLEGGALVETGRFDELIARNGRFARMFEAECGI